MFFFCILILKMIGIRSGPRKGDHLLGPDPRPKVWRVYSRRGKHVAGGQEREEADLVSWLGEISVFGWEGERQQFLGY